MWLQRNGFDHVVFDTNEAVATPVLLHELTGSGKDFGYEQQHREQKNDLRSVGFNADWNVSDRSASASTSTIRGRAACRMIRSPVVARRRSASRARCRAPASRLC